VEIAQPLSELEREILEYVANSGETTTEIDEELPHSPGRKAVEAALGELLRRGLVTTARGVYASSKRVYEDDWWDPTPAGRAAIGLPPR